MRITLLGTTAFGCVLACLTPANAAPQLENAAPQAENAAPQLEEIIVTATHRKENNQKTAIAITAVSSATLQAAGVVQSRDLSKLVAGLSITASGPGTQTYLRGVGTFNTGTYSSSPVATNLDDIYLSLPAMTNSIFYDLARVEVLKGPQGTLYGKNATAGAINIITNQPTDELTGDFSQEIGNYGLFKTNAAVNVPLSDKVFVRLAGQFLNRGGYYSDNTGRTGAESVRLQVLFKPTDDISLTIGGDYQHATGQEEPLVVFGANPDNPWEGPTTAASNRNIILARNPANGNGIGLPPFFSALLPTIQSGDLTLRNDNAGVRGDLEWNLGFANLSVLSSWRHLTTLFDNDPGFLSQQRTMGDQETVELRLASPSDNGPLKWQAGLYYFRNNSPQALMADQGFIVEHLDYTDTDTSGAAFGEATYSILPDLRLTGGLRGTTETIKQDGAGDDIFPPATFASLTNFLKGSGVPPFIIPGIVDSTLTPVNYSVTNAATFRNISVKAGVEYDVAPNSLAYATFSTGFKSGGINADLNTARAPNIYKPEILDAYSIGSKNRFFNGLVQVNAEAFYWKYKNHQEIYLSQSQADPTVSLPLTHNIGAATVKGISLDGQWRPTADDLLAGQLEYLNSDFSNFQYDEYSSLGYRPNTGCETSFLGPVKIAGQPQALNHVNCDGRPFTRAPRFAINLSYQHVFDLGGSHGDVVALISTHLTTSQWLAVDYLAPEKEGAQSVTDLNITYEPPDAPWSITGYVRNIENTASYSSAFAYAFATNVFVGGINPPRTFGGIFKVHF
jgi:iron complex outermembrane receptor protein